LNHFLNEKLNRIKTEFEFGGVVGVVGKPLAIQI
jgi:hypothetical protein